MSDFKALNVRASFPHIFKPNTKFGPDGKREVILMLHKEKHADLIAALTKEIDSFKAQIKGGIPSDMICLKDGDLTDRPEYAGHMIIKPTSKKVVPVFDRNRDLLDSSTGEINGGDWINCQFNLWLQNNPYGVRVNSQLEGVQFIKADSFGGGKDVDDVKNAFDVIDDDEF